MEDNKHSMHNHMEDHDHAKMNHSMHDHAEGVLYNQGILISPALGAVFMSLCTIIVAINARMLKID